MDQLGNKVKEILSIDFDKLPNGKFHCVIVILCDDGIILEIDIPEIKMDEITIINETIRSQTRFCDCTISRTMKVNLGEGIVSPINGIFFTLRDITEYQEMTVREIEKELGYKIKLIEK